MKQIKITLRKLENISYLCTMKIFVNKRGNAFAIIIAAKLYSMTNTQAQDITRTIDNIQSDFSLIQTNYNTDEWIVYNMDDTSSYFGMVNATGTTTTLVKTGQKLFVKDMEIISDTLYFCGSIYDSTTGDYNAVMGYFRAVNMTTSTIRYVQIDSLTNLDKISYYKFVTTKHVIMLGIAKNGDNVIVDALHDFQISSTNPNSWRILWARFQGTHARFDDIISIGDNVAVSAHITDFSSFPDTAKTYLCYIEKNPMINVPFFGTGVAQMQKLGQDIPRPVLLARGKQDTLLAAYIYSNKLYVAHSLKNSGIVMTKKTSLPYSYSPRIPFYVHNLLGIAHDRSKDRLGILIELIPTPYPAYYRIYQYPTSSASFTDLYYNEYKDCTLYSIGNGLNGHSLCAGKYSTGEWGVFHGEYSDPFSNNNLECATTSIVGYGNATGPYYLSEDIELSYSEMTRTAEVMPKTNVQATVTTVCNN
jgi:hypothetical protein